MPRTNGVTVSDEGISRFEAAIWTRLAAGQEPNLAVLISQLAPLGEQRIQIAVETLFTDGEDPLQAVAPRGMRSVRSVSAGSFSALRLLDGDGEWLLISVATASPGVYHLMSAVPRTDPRWQRVERWVNGARVLSRCFLNHRDFAAIGDRLSEFARVEVVKVAARMVKDGSSINRGFPQRDGFERPNHVDEIREIEQMGASVRTLTLHIEDTLDVHLRRVAGATYYGGDFRVFVSQVLSRLEEAAAERQRLLTGRARRSPADNLPSVSVSLGAFQMDTADDTGDLLNVVGTMTDFTMAVFHRNPYLHFAVTDELDGSNFDVLVTRPEAIDIYPGYRSSASSFARVTQRLAEAFGAISIADGSEPEPVSLYELR